MRWEDRYPMVTPGPRTRADVARRQRAAGNVVVAAAAIAVVLAGLAAIAGVDTRGPIVVVVLVGALAAGVVAGVRDSRRRAGR